MSRLSSRSHGGFALIEILVSLMVLAIGIFSAVGVFVSSQKSSSTAQRTDVAVTLGTKALEEMRAREYSNIAVSQVAAFPAGVEGDPRTRVVAGGTRFDTQLPAGQEERVAFAAGAPPEYEVVTVGGLTARVWRFVSWRDEECPLVDLGDLGDTLLNLKQTLTLLVGSGGVLANLTGPGGGLDRALTDSNALLGGNLGGLLSGLLTPLTTLVNRLDPLADALDPLEAPLTALLAQLNAITAPLSEIVGVLDLCDLPPGMVPDLSRLAAVNAALSALAPTITSLSSALNPVATLVHTLAANPLGLLGFVLGGGVTTLGNGVTSLASYTVGNLNAILAGVETTLGDTLTLQTLDDVALTAGESLEGIETLLNAPDHTHNTKRISVAVQILPNARGKSVGPSKPVWLSTVVHDPRDGLL